jgi:hypothetical protein
MPTENMVPSLSKAEIEVSETKMLTETKSVDIVTEKMSPPKTPLRIRQPSKPLPSNNMCTTGIDPAGVRRSGYLQRLLL